MKRSFLNRLAGSASDDFDSFEDDLPPATLSAKSSLNREAPRISTQEDNRPVQAEGQLPVDLYQTPTEIIMHAFVAGVPAADLNVSIRRDMVEISGARQEREQVSGPDYFSRELFWGSFSRSVLLPQEVDVEASTAYAKDGLLTIVMPKLDKARQTKLKVRAG